MLDDRHIRALAAIGKTDLNRRMRRYIECFFYQFRAEQAQYLDRRNSIIESGLTVCDSQRGSRYKLSSPVQSKAEALELLDQKIENDKSWFCVVRGVFEAYRGFPHHDIMLELYLCQKPKSQIIKEHFDGGKNQTTFWRWREEWLEKAYERAKEYELL